jgi:hypothetical protein
MQLFQKGLLRGVIPFSIFLVFSLWNYFQGSTESAHTFLINGLIVFFLGVTSVIYLIRKWSFVKQIVVHYLVMLVTVFPTLLLSGYYPLDSVVDLLMVYLHFNKVGIILFLATYFISTLIYRSRSKFSNAKPH